MIIRLKPDAVIHCAAWTAVDAAEEPKLKAYVSVTAVNMQEAAGVEKRIKEDIEKMVRQDKNKTDRNPKVSVIIPTLNAEQDLANLLDKLAAQDHAIDEIIVVDSASDDRTVEICKNDNRVKLIQIVRNDFDHGGTRDMALRRSVGDIIVFLTQDAVPAKKDFIDRLIAPLQEEDVAVSTGRQLPKAGATKTERLVRSFNYPKDSCIKSKEDIPRMGIKTFFCSDVCAAYDREIYLKLGGFLHPVKTNEDMFFAAKAIRSGYRIAYAADAVVRHSHNLTLKEQYKRNFVQGYEMEKHRELLDNVSQGSEGVRMVKYVSKELLKHGHVGSFVFFCFDCFARFSGNRRGKKAFIRDTADAWYR